MEQNFQTEVLTRLAVIESKLDDYKSNEEKTDEAYNLSKANEKRLDKNEEKSEWSFRLAIGAIITGGIGLAYEIIKYNIIN